jgi:hypothetical protein
VPGRRRFFEPHVLTVQYRGRLGALWHVGSIPALAIHIHPKGQFRFISDAKKGEHPAVWSLLVAVPGTDRRPLARRFYSCNDLGDYTAYACLEPVSDAKKGDYTAYGRIEHVSDAKKGDYTAYACLEPVSDAKKGDYTAYACLEPVSDAKKGDYTAYACLEPVSDAKRETTLPMVG